MAEENLEAAAEDAILGAVVEQPPVNQPDVQDIDQPDEIDAREDEVADDQGEQDAKTQAEPEPEDDYIEIEGEDGAEPTRLKLADVLESHKAYQALKGREAETLERVEREVTERAVGGYRQIEQASKQTGFMIQAAMQLLQAPRAPDVSMLDSGSNNYNPEAYYRADAQYRQASQQHAQAMQLGQHLMQQAEAAASQAKEASEARELVALQRIWPEFGQADVTDKFVSDMREAYGFTPQELDEVLVDHRQALVARDALAYRQMKAKGVDTKAKVEAKAPKLVRSKQESKGSAQVRNKDGTYATKDSFKRAMNSQSDSDWVNHFANLSKQGRI